MTNLREADSMVTLKRASSKREPAALPAGPTTSEKDVPLWRQVALLCAERGDSIRTVVLRGLRLSASISPRRN